MSAQIIPKNPGEWADAVADAITHIKKGGRKFTPEQTLSFIDYLVQKSPVKRLDAEAKNNYVTDDVMTHLSLVTTGVHGGGEVPKGGWYEAVGIQSAYYINPGFAAAWISARGL